MNNKIQEKLEIAINEIMNDHDIPQDLKDKFSKIREDSKKEWEKNCLIDESYENYEKNAVIGDIIDSHYEPATDKWNLYNKEEFISFIKKDDRFSKKWGLKIDESYENYEKNIPESKVIGSDTDPLRQFMVWKRKTDHSSGYPIFERLTKEEFINKIKTDDEFANKWGLKIDESYENYEKNAVVGDAYKRYTTYIHDVVQGENQTYGDWYGKEEFINKIKTDDEFANKWELKIEERVLSLEERATIWNNTHNPVGNIYTHNQYDENDIPTKLITITYKDNTIESYE